MHSRLEQFSRELKQDKCSTCKCWPKYTFPLIAYIGRFGARVLVSLLPKLSHAIDSFCKFHYAYPFKWTYSCKLMTLSPEHSKNQYVVIPYWIILNLPKFNYMLWTTKINYFRSWLLAGSQLCNMVLSYTIWSIMWGKGNCSEYVVRLYVTHKSMLSAMSW